MIVSANERYKYNTSFLSRLHEHHQKSEIAISVVPCGITSLPELGRAMCMCKHEVEWTVAME